MEASRWSILNPYGQNKIWAYIFGNEEASKLDVTLCEDPGVGRDNRVQPEETQISWLPLTGYSLKQPV